MQAAFMNQAPFLGLCFDQLTVKNSFKKFEFILFISQITKKFLNFALDSPASIFRVSVSAMCEANICNSCHPTLIKEIAMKQFFNQKFIDVFYNLCVHII